MVQAAFRTSEIDCLHGPGAVVMIVRLGVSVVEAATVVVVSPARNHVKRLWFVASRCAVAVVDSVTHPAFKVRGVHWVATNRQPLRSCVRCRSNR